MQKLIVYRPLALIMALLITFSSVGYSIDLHFCQGNLKGFQFFGQAENCHTQLLRCPNHSVLNDAQNEDNGCCQNKNIQVDELDQDRILIESQSLESSIDHGLLTEPINIEHISSSVISLAPEHPRPPPLQASPYLFLFFESFLL